MHRSLFSINRVAAILVMGSAVLVAQGTQTANMTGEVRDDAKAPLAGATIRLTSPSMQGARTLTTDEKGRFTVRLLPPGVYQIEVWKTGFQTVKISEKLGIDQNYQPTILMTKVQGAIVEVIATASAAVDKTDVKTATNYNLDTVDELPTLDRRMETLAALSPGVTDNGVGGRIQVRGAMTSGNLTLVDGQNVADNVYQTRGVDIIQDSVEETQVITGAISAEYGNVDGGVINSITRSGSNTFSGQARWELSNPQWDALVPTQSPSQLSNLQSSTYTLSLGGPIIKDKVWFFLSYYRASSNQEQFLAPGSNSTDSGAGYNYNQDEVARQIKLTYAINDNHTLVASFYNMSEPQNPRDYYAGDLEALDHQTDTESFYSIALRSVWSPSVTSEIRYGQKHQVLQAGALVPGYPLFEDGNSNGFFVYQSGLFNFNDGGDHRDNRTFSGKVSLFWDASGSHQTDLGIDYYEGERRAANQQATYNQAMDVDLVNETGATETLNGNVVPTGSVLAPLDIEVYQSDPRESISTTYGVYANDKWSLDKNFSFQIGFRGDKYSAKDTTGSTTVSATGFSPRLGVNWDINGDSVWLVKASWAIYDSGVADAIAGVVSNTGNPTETNYVWTGANTASTPANPTAINYNNVQTEAAAMNPANYGGYTAAGGFNSLYANYYLNPTLNVKLASGLHSPHVQETQLSGAYSFKSTPIGTGFVRLTLVNKVWSDLFDYSVGNNGTVNDQFGNSYYVETWGNSSVAQRKYKDMELEVSTTLNGWTLDGNITWSDLEGNYQGEGVYTPLSGQGLQYYTNVNGQTMYDSSITNPYGKLIGDTPIRMRGLLSKSVETSWGKTTYGFIYRFDSGLHYSYTRLISPSALNPAFGTTITTFGSSATQYENNTRGAGVYPGQSYLDMAITQDLTLGTVAGVPVKAFVKLVMQNFLNHQQIISTNTQFNSPANGNLTDPWVSNVGPLNSGNFGAARTIVISAGVKF